MARSESVLIMESVNAQRVAVSSTDFHEKAFKLKFISPGCEDWDCASMRTRNSVQG